MVQTEADLPAESWAESISDPSWRMALFRDDPWQAFHLRARTEKVVQKKASLLSVDDAVSVLPCWNRSKVYQRRVVKTVLPLFPNYIFMRANDSVAAEFASRTKEIVTWIPVADQTAFQGSMIGVAKMIFGGVGIRPEPKIKEGMLVELVAGSMQGLKGRVIKERKTLRFLVALDLLHAGASVEVEEWMIEPID